MVKRKKIETLTKIDPRTLKPKFVAVSQHAGHNGARVTTTVNPIRVLPVSPIDPLAFDLDPAGLNGYSEEEEEEDEDENERAEDASKGYYHTRVCVLSVAARWLIVPRMTPFLPGERKVTYSSKSSFDSKAKG